MPLTLLAMNFAVFCDGKEMETHAVQQEGVSTLLGYLASEAGKVSVQQVFKNYHHEHRLSVLAIQNHREKRCHRL
jgi:hypothetical protein